MLQSVYKLWSLGILLLVVTACSSPAPLEELQNKLARYPEYSIILQDMKEEGNFFTSYLHQYKIVYGDSTAGTDSLEYKTQTTDWYEVEEKEYRKYQNNLGMALFSKTRDGGISDVQHPPGYQYVGNSQYGQWRTRSDGGSFWEWYGKFAFFSTMFNMMSGPVRFNDYNGYRTSARNRRPYYGKNNQYGTTGSQTKKSNSSFFQRKAAREQARKSRFSDRVRNKTGRSRSSGFRSRSGGFGK